MLNALGITSIDYFVAGHYHADHIGAIDELINGGIPINIASYDRGGAYSSQTYTGYVNAVGAKRTTIALNQQIDSGAASSSPASPSTVRPRKATSRRRARTTAPSRSSCATAPSTTSSPRT